jgi:Iap family predicted aminopeptidase
MVVMVVMLAAKTVCTKALLLVAHLDEMLAGTTDGELGVPTAAKKATHLEKLLVYLLVAQLAGQ